MGDCIPGEEKFTGKWNKTEKIPLKFPNWFVEINNLAGSLLKTILRVIELNQ